MLQPRPNGDKSHWLQLGRALGSFLLPAATAPFPSSLLARRKQAAGWSGTDLHTFIGMERKGRAWVPKGRCRSAGAGGVQQAELAEGGWGRCPQPGSSSWLMLQAAPCSCGDPFPCLPLPMQGGSVGPWLGCSSPAPSWGMPGVLWGGSGSLEGAVVLGDSLTLLSPSACGAAG